MSFVPKLLCTNWIFSDLWAEFQKHIYQNTIIDADQLYPPKVIDHFKTIATVKSILIVPSFHYCYRIFKNEKNLIKFIQQKGIFIAVVWLMPIESYFSLNPFLTKHNNGDDNNKNIKFSGQNLQIKTIYNTDLLDVEKKGALTDIELRHKKFEKINNKQSVVFFNRFKQFLFADKYLAQLPTLNYLEIKNRRLNTNNFLDKIYASK